ncbi:carbohydrate ABC transporter permease [Alicyclobacillus fodiniaquatilis]|jgi:putative aldouronate transport system permease protein|uniref:Carbohydrate ABC transporter permease n=1 Tax=Alicyclobacillus fodiniaquatilis TaxID=1661150 RepID=A0ABW4JE18_9BACL
MIEGKTIGDRTFNWANVLIMIILMILTLYPFWYALIGSLDTGNDYALGQVFLWPRQFTLANYKTVLVDPALLEALVVTITRTLIVTVVSVLYTAMFAYAFSRGYLRGKKWYAAAGFCSMYVGGGLVPLFMLLNWLHLYDNYLVYILPGLFSFWNVIIFTANFRSIPDSLIESAKMDGASEFRIFFQLILPLSKPVLAALSVFTAVGVWNDYTTTLFFTQSQGLQTLQYYILKLIQSVNAVDALQTQTGATSLITGKMHNVATATSAQTVQLAAMVVAAIPMIIMYPFAQKYFIKGVLIGSIKE